MTTRLGTTAAAALVPLLAVTGCTVFGGSAETPIADRVWENPDTGDEHPTVYEHGDRVLMYAGTEFTALSVETGEELWTVTGVVGNVHVTDDAAIIRTHEYRVVSAVDLTTGEERVLLEGEGEEVFDNIAVAGDTLFTHEPAPGDRSFVTRLTARELSHGDELWYRDFDPAAGDDFGRRLAVHAPVAVPQPFAADSDEPSDIVAVASNAVMLYVSNDSWDGTASATLILDVGTGDIVETRSKPLLDLEHLKPLITEDGVLITERFMGGKGKCEYIVDVTDGGDTHTMKFSAYSMIDLDECAESGRAPWMSGEYLCGTDTKGRPQLVDWTTGEVIWRESDVPGDVFGCEGRVVIRLREGVKEGNIIGVDTQDGEKLWEQDAGDDERRYARVIHEGLLINAGGTNAIAVDPATGDRLWKVFEDTGIHCRIVGVGSGRVYVESDAGLIAVDTGRN